MAARGQTGPSPSTRSEFSGPSFQTVTSDVAAISQETGPHPLEALRGEGAVDSGLDGFLAETRGTDGTARSDSGTTAARSPELPRPAVQQLIEALRLAPGRVDLALTPEELGRVTLTLQTQDGALSVIVFAERNETADLIRRSLDALLQEAKEQGFDDVNLGFGGHGSFDEGFAEHARDDIQRPEHSIPATFKAEGSNPERAAAVGLDLRL